MSIEQQLKTQVTKKIRSAAISVLPIVNKHIEKAYRKADFVASLENGLLQGSFGLTTSKAKSATDAILSYLIANTKSEFISGSGSVLGTLRVTVKTGLSQSLLSDTEYYSGKHRINWLHWLTAKGTQVVVEGAEIEYSSSPRSRSGKASMVENEGGVYRVPPRFAGTEGDNVISRLIWAEVPAIRDLMVKEIKKQFK